MLRLVVDYPSAAAFLDAVEQEVANGGLLIRGARTVANERDCVVEVRIAGETVAEAPALVGTVARFGVTVSFEEPPAAILALAEQLRVPPPPPEEAGKPVQPTVAQKIAHALSGDREARLGLLRDHNKALHAFVLRNPRIQLDEVLFAAKLTTLAPDALKAISEHTEWSQNPSVCIALVRNPKTPLPIALRLLPKLPATEIKAIAKGGARDQLVFAARKLRVDG